ncbi:uncharacterized protein MONOS_4020 [Monocercomonoides exilis]|uniref:uncharacterized protein n=1 Tax=Monocercomonoides exilis TaxID=2049356 RepID=UPI00355AC8EE|nr:hypothetical protein MONOS_4020 [Monocercomonoides exilis]
MFNANDKFSLFSGCNTFSKMQTMSVTERFNELFSELEHYAEDEQKQKIEEIIVLMEEMDEEELYSTFTKELFEKIDKMIEEEKLTMENAILLLKHMGFCNALKDIWNDSFRNSLLKARFEKMVAEEDEKKGDDEKLFIDLIECYLLLDNRFSLDLYHICVPCLLKVALKKEEDEETQKEVEIALLALSCINSYCDIERDLYLNEIKEIIQYHQKHRNLTRLAYQSAWSFLVFRYCKGFSSEIVIVNEQHFAREARRELEELSKSVNWKKKEEEMGKTERKTIDIISRWISSIGNYFYSCHLWSEKYTELISRIVDVLRASRDNHSEICEECIQSFDTVTGNRAVKFDALLKGGAIDAALEEIQRPILNISIINEFIYFFHLISLHFKGKGEVNTKEEERKELKRNVFEKQEEEGFEDIITSFQKVNRFYFDDDTVFIQL